MNKELEALKELWYGNKSHENLETIEKALKEKEKQDEVLRIIREKGVNVGLLMVVDTFYDYRLCMTYKPLLLTKAEFDLLKECFNE